jgi:hypothetical protein
VRLFQHHRDDRSWVWPRQAPPAHDITVTGLGNDDSGSQVATFLFHLSAVITDAAVAELAEPIGRRVNVQVEAPSVSWLRSSDQIKWIATATREAFEQTMRGVPACRLWRVLYAAGLSAFWMGLGCYLIAQKMSSDAMNRSASSSGKTVRPNGPALVQRSFHKDQ